MYSSVVLISVQCNTSTSVKSPLSPLTFHPVPVHLVLVGSGSTGAVVSGRTRGRRSCRPAALIGRGGELPVGRAVPVVL